MKATDRSRLPNLLSLMRWVFGGWTVLIFLFLYIPIILLVVYSFNASRLNILWEGFSTRWYAELLKDTVLLTAFKNSLYIASITTVIATALGTLGAWLLYRYRFPLVGVIGLLIFIPMVIPEVLMGVSLMQLFVAMGLQPGYWTVIIAHITFCFPFVVIPVQARLEGMDPFLEEAAQDLGANPVKAFCLVILPYLLPAVISGCLMAFTLSMDEYIVTVFTNGPHSQTLPQKVYGMVKKGLNPSLNALSTLFILATIVIVFVSEAVSRLGARKS